MTTNHHTLLIDETEIPEKYKPVLDRLAQAVQNPEVQKYMQIEDDFLAELDLYYDSLEEERKLKEEERKLKEEERKLKEDAIIFMYKSGFSLEDISKNLKINLDDLKEIVK